MFEYSASGDAAPDSRLEAAFVELLDRQATAPRGERVSPEEPRAGCIDVLHPTRRTGRAWLYLGTTCSDRASDSAAAEAADVAESAGITTTASGETDAEPVAPLVHHLERGVEFLHEAREADREISRQAARRAQQLHAFARQRPMDLFDRAPGERGALSAAARAARPDALTDVSEWAVHEVSTAFNISRPAASGLLAQSVALVERLPATLAGLAEAQLTPAHASVMVEVVGPIDDADVRATAEHRLLDRLGRKTPPELRAAARRVVLRLDAKAAADRMVRAVRDRHVRLSDGRDGMAVLAAVLAGPIGQACLRTLAALAEETRTEGDERTHAQRMADCLADLILRPGQSGLPPVQIALTVVASAETLLGGDEPGEVEGTLVPAEMVRELAYTLGLLPRPAPQNGQPAAPGPAEQPDPAATDNAGHNEPAPEVDAEPSLVPEPSSEAAAELSDSATRAEGFGTPGWLQRRQAEIAAQEQRALDDAAIGAAEAAYDGRWTDGEARDLLDLAALLTVRAIAGTTLAHRPHIAVVDKLRGTLVALTDARAISRCEALGPPPDTDGYRPADALDRFVRLRDRRCRFPGCRQRPRKCDLDHQCPWPEGPTAHDNLCCLCETHHRLKHQAPGWSITAVDDHGGLAFQAPSGEVIVTHPPTFGADDDLPPF